MFKVVGVCLLILLLCVYGRVVWQCFLSLCVVLFHLCISPYIQMLVVVTALLHVAVSMWARRRQDEQCRSDSNGVYRDTLRQET